MCTDGLVEVRGEDIGVGLTALRESAAHPAASMDGACDTIIRAGPAEERTAVRCRGVVACPPPGA